MGTDSGELVEALPNPCFFKVHHTMCTELSKLVDRILRVIPDIERARPCGIHALCLLTSAIVKAKQLLLYCFESSKLYLDITGDSILSKCQKARKSLVKNLVQIQNMVPVMLAAEISRLIDDLECMTFVLNSAEEAAGKRLKQLIQQQDPSTSSDKDLMEKTEIKDFQFVAATLGITSPMAFLIEKRSINKLLEKVKPNDQKEIILNSLLFLLIKHRKSITGEQMEVYSQSEGSITIENSGHESQRILHVMSHPYLNHGQYRTHASELRRHTPPEEYTCPISFRLMYDPVVIASGETYERMWIQKWFAEGNTICPKTKKKLNHMVLTPNVALKDFLILKWCENSGVSIPDPSMQVQDLHSWDASSNSIRSFGSCLYDLNFSMELSNMSLGSLDSSYNSNSSHVKANHSSNLKSSNTSENSCRRQSPTRIHDADLMHLSKLQERQWESQCRHIEYMKIDIKCNYQAFCSVSPENFIVPLTRFLSTACEKHDVKALRAGTKLLLEFTKCCRNGMMNLSEDTCIMLANLLDTEVIGEALTIMEELTENWNEKAGIAASSVLTSVSKILDSGNEEFQRKAIKIMYNFSSNGQICPYMVSLECIPKLLPFFKDKTLVRDCIHILKNLCDTRG